MGYNLQLWAKNNFFLQYVSFHQGLWSEQQKWNWNSVEIVHRYIFSYADLHSHLILGRVTEYLAIFRLLIFNVLALVRVL